MDEQINLETNVSDLPADEITEQLFKAIDAIIINRLKNFNYDSYVLATVTNASEAAQGKYIVTTDNNITFDAYSERTDLFVGIQAYVRIPHSDYTQRKVIAELYEPYTVQQNKNQQSIQQIEYFENKFITAYRNAYMNSKGNNVDTSELLGLIDDYLFQKIRLQEESGIVLTNPYTLIKENILNI